MKILRHVWISGLACARLTGRPDIATERVLIGDYLINDWQGAGLLFPSVATGIVRTVKPGMIASKLGSVTSSDMKAVDSKLRLVLGLS